MARKQPDYPLGAVVRDVLWGLLAGVALSLVVFLSVAAVQTLWRVLPYLWRVTW
jgi:hypothetical protein